VDQIQSCNTANPVANALEGRNLFGFDLVSIWHQLAGTSCLKVKDWAAGKSAKE